MKKIRLYIIICVLMTVISGSLLSQDHQIRDIDGNYYNIVTIGTQVWMAENLKTTKYNGGIPIQNVTDAASWAALSTPGYCWFNNNEITYKNTYGALYNWYTVNTGILCPTGWHVPTDAEWTLLSTYLGGESVSGGKLKETGTLHWLSPNTGATNETGFTALPGGYRDDESTFFSMGYASTWWAATQYSSSNGIYRVINNDDGSLLRDDDGDIKRNGLSIRCVHDGGTLYTTPSLSTTTVTSVNNGTAISGGNVTADGGTDVISKGICWDTSPNPSLSGDYKTTNGSGTGTFVSQMSGLAPGTTYYVRAYATNSEGTAYGNQITFTTNEGNAITDIEGNSYNIVTIGSQVWMAENLRTTLFNDGTPIPNITGSTEWSALTTAAYAWYNNDANANKNTYGGLYNWYAVNTGKICPTGWHVPTNDDWITLTNYLIESGYNYDGTTTGNKIAKSLAASFSWTLFPQQGAVGNTDYPDKRNSSGFTAISSGGRYWNGGFSDMGTYTTWWNSNDYSTEMAYMEMIGNSHTGLTSPQPYYKYFGFSVRCLAGEGTVLPQIETRPMLVTGSTHANSGGIISSNGGAQVFARGVCWSTVSGPTIADNHTTDGSGTGIFLSNIKGLNSETKYYLRAYATNNVGTAYGNEITFTTTSPVIAEEYSYKTIIIGTQTWMQENLRTTKYANGDDILDGSLKGDLTSEPAPKYWFYYKDLPSNIDPWGRFYTWYAASDRRNVCPTGWHVPTEAEWNTLKYYLKANGYGYDNTDNVGKALASSDNWEADPTPGTPGNDPALNNSTGFNGLPGGNRNWTYNNDPLLKFYGQGKYGRFQSLNEWDTVTAIMGKLDMNLADFNVWADGNKHGFNVRCLKGDPPTDIIYWPTLSTMRISKITTTSASTGGNVVTDGYSPVAAKGICWSTSPHPTVDLITKTSDGSGLGPFVSNMTGLSAGQKYYVRAYATNVKGTAYGEELTFTTYRADAITDVDGNYYNIVEIGTQIWLQENLRTTKFNDGSVIDYVEDGNTWYNTTTDAYCFMNNDPSTYKDLYGALYNYFTVIDSRNLCPLGWRVPSDSEWATLTSHLGGVAVAGGKMKEQGTVHWTAPNIVAETVSGFTALGAGERLPNGNYGYLGTSTFYWSTTESSTTQALTNAIENNSEACDHAPNDKKWGFSVRCINDQLMVTNTNESGAGSFRNALDYSNSNPGKDTIVFNIPGLGPFTIAPLTPFPEIIDSVFIDGYSQPGTGRASSNSNAKLLIELDGINLTGSMGLYVTVGKSKISGLMINRFGIDGIQLVYGGSNIIEGNYIGVDADGKAKVNLTGALRIAASPDNIIGGSKPENRNVMAAGPNGGSYLIFMLLPQTTNNWITGNYLGVGPDGETKVGQSKIGIQLNEGSHHNTIGPSNVISGNAEAGIQMQPLVPNFPNNNRIIGNYVGTNKTGTVAVGNKNGIAIYNASENIIGGKTPGERNIISGNTDHGIIINFSSYNPPSGNTIQGNFIGLNAAGSQAIKNGATGMWIYAKGNIIGGSEAGTGNVISGNGGDGIHIWGHTVNSVENNSSDNKIQGNLIGTDYSGLKPVGNGGNGILIGHYSGNNLVGGTEPGTGNLIAYNKMAGMTCVGTLGIVTGNKILSNSIHSNGLLGIDLGTSGVTPNDSSLFEEPDVYHFDNDAGPNNLQNFPVISTVKFDLGIKKIILGGYLKSIANSKYTLQFFANKIDDAQGYGEGQRYLGSAIVKTGADGKAMFDTSFTHYSSWGDIISSTATDAQGNTSEFSMNIGGMTRQIIAASSWPFYYYVNEDGIKRITDESDIAAVESSFTTWNNVSTAKIDFRSGGTTPNKYASSNDGVNLVTFTDDKFPFSPGVLAVAAKTLRLSPTSDIAEIIDADIVVNPAYARYDVGVGYEGSNTGYFDAQSVITHEVGHVLGLLHTGIVSSTMFYTIDKGTSLRSLEQDDVSWASFTYPGDSYNSIYGSISGKITYGYDDSHPPVAGALVVAMNTSTNEEVHGYSDAEGNYTVPGLIPGSYNIHIQPLDGSESVNNLKPANISAYLYNNTIYLDYPGEYYSSPESETEDPSIPETALSITVSANSDNSGNNLITNKDLAGPVVVTVTPVNETLDFDIDKDIIVTFSEPVDPATLTDETCYIESDGTKHGVSHTPLGNSSSVIMLSPDSPFEYLTPYTLHITKGVKDLRENELVLTNGVTEYQSTFTTIDADLIPPEVINVYPLDKVDSVFVTDRIIVFFSEPMNRSSVENSLIVSWINDNTSVLNKTVGSYVWGTDNKSVTFIPLKTLMENEEYTIKVTKGATDLSGLPLLIEKTFTFLTVPAAPPEVIYIGPDNGTVNNSITTPVVVDFSEPIDPYTISKSTFGLFLNGTLVPGTYKFLNDNSRVVYIPDADLVVSTTYTVTLTSGIKDLPAPGIALSNPKTTTFRTADKPTSVSLTYIDPPAGAIGSVVTIGGVGFDPDPSLNTIKFNGISAVVTASTLTTLTTEVPVGAISGFVTVTSGINNTPATNQMDFYVVPQSTDPCNSATASSSAGTNNTGGTDLYGEALVFVTNPLSNTVTVVNTKAGSTGSPIVATIDVGQRPMKIDINPQGTMAYVSNYLSNDVSVLDITDLKNIRQVAVIKVGIHPYGVAVTPDGKRVYVANQYTNNLSVIDVDPKSGGFDHVVANVPVGTNPNDVEITADAGLVLVAGDFGLQIINGNPNDEKYNCAVANVASGTKTTEVEVTADAGLAIVATEDNNLLVINLKPEDGDYTDAVVANIPAGTDISNIEVSGDAVFVYVSAPDSNLIQMYRIGYGASGTPNGTTSGDFNLIRHGTITGVENPDAMAIDPYSINLFVVNDGPDKIVREITTITLCCGPVDPAKTISDLIASIQDLNINQSIKDDLVFRLNEVLRNLAAGKNKTAMNNLNTFTNKINSLINSRKITREQGQPLIDVANKLKDQINLLPKGKSGDVENPETGLLNESGLGVIYPNPSSKAFTIEYEVSEMDDLAGKVQIRIIDMNGNAVNTLLDLAVHTGRYTLTWDGTYNNGTPAPGGTYFVHFRSGGVEKVKMIILIR